MTPILGAPKKPKTRIELAATLRRFWVTVTTIASFVNPCALREAPMAVFMASRKRVPPMRARKGFAYTISSGGSWASRRSNPAQVIPITLAMIPIQVLTAIAVATIRLAPAESPAPTWWVTTTLAPIPMKLKKTSARTTNWFATPRAATAPSDTWLTMKVSTVPIRIRSVCSMKIGHAIARSDGCECSPSEDIEGTSLVPPTAGSST